MPYNQLLLPLLGGYLLVSFTHLSSYWTSRQPRDQLLLMSALVGAVLLAIAKLLVFLLLSAPFEIGLKLYRVVHAVADYEGVGTATLALLLGIFFTLWLRAIWSRQEAGKYLYATEAYTQLERFLFESSLGGPIQLTYQSLPRELFRRMLLGAFNAVRRHRYLPAAIRAKDEPPEPPFGGEPLPIMLTMKDRKVYVGFIEWVPPLRADSGAHLRIRPVWSGRRDKDSLCVTRTDDYVDALTKRNGQGAPMVKLLPASEVASFSFYDSDTFDAFNTKADEPVDVIMQPCKATPVEVVLRSTSRGWRR